MPGLHGFAAGLAWLLSRRRPGYQLLGGGEAAAAADGAGVGHPVCAKVVFSLRAGPLPRLRQRAGAGTKLGLRRADVGTGRGWDPGAACGPFTDVGRGDGATGVAGGSRSRRGDGPTGVAMERCRGRGGGPVPVATVGNSQRGFTLIEVLLATTLLALGLALAFATLRAATATVERGEVIAARSERMRAVDGFLRRRLAQATPIAFAIDEGSGRMIRFIGEPDRMRFVADLPDYLGRGGPHLHDVAVLDGEGGSRLAVSFAMVASGAIIEDRQARPPETLVPDLAQARFRYRGLGEDGLLGEWTDTWEQVDMLPLQVSVELASRGGGTWPPLVVMLPQRMGGMVP